MASAGFAPTFSSAWVTRASLTPAHSFTSSDATLSSTMSAWMFGVDAPIVATAAIVCAFTLTAAAVMQARLAGAWSLSFQLDADATTGTDSGSAYLSHGVSRWRRARRHR